MNENIVVPGSTQATWQFGRELKRQLTYFSQYPYAVCKAAKAGTVLKSFQEYLKTRKIELRDFELVLFKAPYNARGHNHHWIIIDDGYYVDFFEGMLKHFKGDHRPLSNAFLSEFCEFTLKDREAWMRDFHVHFLRSDKVGPDIYFWKEFVIARHINSKQDYIRKSRADLWVLDYGDYPYIGFLPIDPKELYYRCRKA